MLVLRAPRTMLAGHILAPGHPSPTRGSIALPQSAPIWTLAVASTSGVYFFTPAQLRPRECQPAFGREVRSCGGAAGLSCCLWLCWPLASLCASACMIRPFSPLQSHRPRPWYRKVLRRPLSVGDDRRGVPAPSPGLTMNPQFIPRVGRGTRGFGPSGFASCVYQAFVTASVFVTNRLVVRLHSC
jgi:hypothetical protein